MISIFDQDTAALVSKQATITWLREELYPYVVLAAYGYYPVSRSSNGQQWLYSSPIRTDTHPSFNVYYTRAGWRYKDFATQDGGSVIDLVQLLEPTLTLQEVWFRSQELYAAQLQGLYMTKDAQAALTTAELAGDDVDVVVDYVPTVVRHSDKAMSVWWANYHLTHPELPDMKVIRDRWEISVDASGTLWIPYWLGDQQVAHKEVATYLSATGQQETVRRFGNNSKHVLYRDRNYVLREDDRRPLVLCEGETDTWIATELLEDTGRVVWGTPSASISPESLLDDESRDWLIGRHVILAFDGDLAGVRATRNWITELDKITDIRISRLPIPKSKDLGGLPRESIFKLFDMAIPHTRDTDYLERAQNPEHYRRRRGAQGQISDWVLDVDHVYFDDKYIKAYSGVMQPHGRRVHITLNDLLNGTNLARWAMDHGAHWFGSHTDVQRLASLLRQEAIFAYVARITQRSGLHEGDYVWPNGSLGKQEWLCVSSQLNMDDMFGLTRIGDDTEVANTLDALLSIASPTIIHPMLAWFAAAPLRPLFNAFPTMHVTGASGSGKTTLVQILQWFMSGCSITTNLTSTTPYAITMYFNSTNAFPVWFDEYRPGAKEDAILTLRQLLRDTYTGQTSSRGSIKGNEVIVSQTLTDVPLIVSGEDTLTEISHLDRSIIIHLPSKVTSSDAGVLKRLDFSSPIALEYLRWLVVNGISRGEFILDQFEAEIQETWGEVLRTRQLHNVTVLRFGWHLLRSFAEQHGYTLPETPVFGAIVDAMVTATNEDPVLAAVRWAYENDTLNSVFVKDTYVYVSATAFLMDCRRANYHGLPFSTAIALNSYLRDKFSAEDARLMVRNKFKRFVRFDQKFLDSDLPNA